MKRVVVATAVALVLAACADVGRPVAPTQAEQPSFATGRDGEPIPGQYIVVFKSGVLDVATGARQLAGAHGGRVLHTYSHALRGFAVRLPDAAVTALRNNPLVAMVEQDAIVTASVTQSPATWGIDRIDQLDLPLTNSYTYNSTGSGVTVYIIDTGIHFTHSEFGGRASTGYDAVTIGGSAADCNGHGTHVAGTVGGSTYGVAKGVNLVAVRVLGCNGSGSTSGVIAGIDWVTANHAALAVANMSLGGGASSTLDQAVQGSIAAGVTYAVAAGNGDFLGRPIDACTQSPARTPEAITVGSTTNADRESSFSNYGTCVDILAPGSGITSAWYTSNTATNTISGTSMAAPHVAGAAALFLTQNPDAAPADIAAGLKSNATPNTITLNSTTRNTPNLLLYTGFIGGTPPVPPGAPSNLTASAVSASQINLGWTDNADNEDSFSIERCSGTPCTFAQIATVGANVTSFSNTGLTASTSYTYRVSARNAGGSSAASNEASATTAAPPPNAAPVARYTWSCSANNRNCSFNGSSSTDDGPLTYNWNFGDGSTATGVTASRRYSSRGTYNVTLTVRDVQGLTDGATCAVQVAKSSTSGSCP